MSSRATQQPAATGVLRAATRRVFAWGLAAAALAFVVHAVPIRDVCPGAGAPCTPGLATTLARADLGWLAALLVAYFGGTFAWAARWRALLGLAGVRVGQLETWRVTLESQAGGILLPGGIGGDALRIGFMTGKGANVGTVVAAVLLDRVLGLVLLAGLAAVFGVVLGGGELGPLAIVLASLPAAFVVGMLVLRWEAFSRAALFVRGPLARVARPVLDYVGDARAPRAILVGLAIGLVVSSTQLLVVRGLLTALGATPSAERWIYVGTTMAFIVAAIPALPGGWGTSDAAFVFFFAKAGVAAPAALAVSLLYRLFWYSSGAAGAVLYLLRQQGSPAASSSDVAPVTSVAPAAEGEGAERKA
jgi:uncharacterized membrane protein YbhN (UPF0104 family)